MWNFGEKWPPQKVPQWKTPIYHASNELQGLVFGLRLSVIVNNTKVLGCVAVVKAIISHLNELLCGIVM